MNVRRPLVAFGVRPILTVILALLLAGVPSAHTQSAREAQPESFPPAVGIDSLANADSSNSPQAIPTDWWTAVKDDIYLSEYHITWQEQVSLPDLPASSAPLGAGAYQAPNRMHNLRTYFAPDAIRISQRTSTQPAWVWGYRFEPASLPNDGQRAEPVLTTPNRIEYRYQGVTVWYENGESGIIQGLIVNQPPPGDFPLVLAGTLTGDLELRWVETGVDFLHAGLPVLRYDSLDATDAHGRVLSWRLALAGRELRVSVEVQEATYPVVVTARISSPDPGESSGEGIAGLYPAPDWMAESDQANARFGFSVSTAGDVNGDGYADVVVGAQMYDNGQLDEGAAFVYYGSQTGLSTAPNWMVDGDQADARLGWAVSTAGDVNGDGYADVLIGVPYYDGGQSDEGRAYVYYGFAGGLSVLPSWVAESDQTDARFGRSLGAAGDVNSDGYADVVIGAALYDAGQTDEGRAFVYHGSAMGLNPEAAWMAEGNQAHAWFGHRVGTAGDVNGDGYDDVIIGAPYSEDQQSGGGWAEVYHGSALGLNLIPDWMAEGAHLGARFGSSVGTAGDVNSDGLADVIVGAQWHGGGEELEGAAYVYLAVTPIAGLEAVNDSPTSLGSATTLTATVTAGTHLTYTWAFADGEFGSGPVVTHTYPTTSVYSAVVTASNRVNELTATTTITVVAPITGLVAHNDSPTPLGRITTLTATIAAGSNATYTWVFGDGKPGSGSVVSHTYPAVDAYMAVVTASNSVSVLTATTIVTVTKVSTYLPVVVRNESAP